MSVHHLLRLVLLLVLVCPGGLLAEKPTPEEADLSIEETLAEEDVTAEDAGTVSPVCGTVSGTRFNLEPRANAAPQHTQTVDILRNRVAAGVDLVVGGSTDLRSGAPGDRSLTGYYVSRDADCAAEFEGRLPAIAGMHGGGRPIVAADPARDAVFMADLRYDATGAVVGVGLVWTTGATLRNATACPNGTHTAAQAATCWPTRRFIPEAVALAPDNPVNGRFSEFHLAVDERTSGTGAGRVYLVSTGRGGDPPAQVVTLMVCTNTLATCDGPVFLFEDDLFPLSRPYVAVRPDGRVTITVLYGPSLIEPTHPALIRYRSCAPAVSLTEPTTCGADSFISLGDRVIFSAGLASGLAGGDLFFQSPLASPIPVTTYPKHDHRQDANGIETYVVWEQCKVVAGVPSSAVYSFCPDADVLMAATTNDGTTWSAPTCVSCGAEDQFWPTMKTDRSRNIVNIVYSGSGSDATFQRRVRLFLAHIPPGAATPDPVTDIHIVTTLLNDLGAGPPLSQWLPGSSDAEVRFLASAPGYIGLAVRGTGADGGSRAYVHSTYNNIQGLYNGVAVPEMNNHLSRLDY